MVIYIEIALCLLLAAVLVLLSVLLYKFGEIAKSLRELKQSLSNDNDLDNVLDEGTQDKSETEDDDDKHRENAPKSVKPTREKTKKERVIEAISLRGEEVGEEDIDRVMEELSGFFVDFAHKDYFSDLSSNNYYRFVDLRKNPETCVVVLGDIHCDYLSLAAALLKLSVSDYDYFENNDEKKK